MLKPFTLDKAVSGADLAKAVRKVAEKKRQTVAIVKLVNEGPNNGKYQMGIRSAYRRYHMRISANGSTHIDLKDFYDQITVEEFFWEGKVINAPYDGKAVEFAIKEFAESLKKALEQD